MFAVIGGCASAIKIIRTLQHHHLDAVLFQLLSQMSNGVFAYTPILTEFICRSFRFLYGGYWEHLRWGFGSLDVSWIETLFKRYIAFQMLSNLFLNLDLTVLRHLRKFTELQRREGKCLSTEKILRAHLQCLCQLQKALRVWGAQPFFIFAQALLGYVTETQCQCF
ncbi:hypothetical protein BBG20_09690 [Pseudomonas aylmerensis]|uniref:Uncharacterized protein n=1 Tax=Pseudomonas aylmerensis TaxID=1869229 RepID=A0ABX2Z0V7_9PSED|nr:hypothetical protein BBG20_09690 [Pseudomonas aylmerensis]